MGGGGGKKGGETSSTDRVHVQVTRYNLLSLICDAFFLTVNQLSVYVTFLTMTTCIRQPNNLEILT